MRNNIQWEESLSVGIDDIDADHKRLFDLIDLLSQAVTTPEPPQYVDALFEECVSFSEFHFRHEERLMAKQINFHQQDHKDEHLDLVALIKDLQARFHKAQHTLTVDNIEYLKEWLKGHIVEQDLTYLQGGTRADDPGVLP